MVMEASRISLVPYSDICTSSTSITSSVKKGGCVEII